MSFCSFLGPVSLFLSCYPFIWLKNFTLIFSISKNSFLFFYYFLLWHFIFNLWINVLCLQWYQLSVIWNFHFCFFFLAPYFILFQLETFLKCLVILACLLMFMLKHWWEALWKRQVCLLLSFSVTSHIILGWGSSHCVYIFPYYLKSRNLQSPFEDAYTWLLTF